MWPLDGHPHSDNIGPVAVLPSVCLLKAQHLAVMFAMRSRLGDERPSMFADMIVEQRYDLYSWYVLLT